MADVDPVLDYAQALRALLATGRPAEELLPQFGAALEPLLTHRTLLRERYDLPRPGEYGSYLLYEDPDYHFVITALVHRPGHRGQVHNHQVWVVYGNYEQEEIIRQFERVDDGTRPDHAELRLTREWQARPGDVHWTLGDAIHVEENHLDVPSVSFVIREHNLGDHLQERFDLATGRVTRRPGVKALPWDQAVTRIEPSYEPT
jgi:predicted metal-dependent enzyme (double-stranded beta helix superfamily)